MKKISISFIALSVMSSLTGCLKDKPNTDFSDISPIIEISNASNNSVAQAPSAGYAYFPAATLFLTGLTGPDTISFTVNVASNYPLKKDLNYTVAVDEAALADLNANTTTNSKGIQYQLFAADQAVLTRTTGVIEAGTRLDTINVIFYPEKIDPTVSYAFPISIKSADPGVTISGNLGTLFFHQIGNPISGVYTRHFLRYPQATATGDPDTDNETSQTFIPDDALTVEVYSGYYTGKVRYVISFTNTNGVLSDFQVVLNDADVASELTANSIAVTTPAHVIKADPATNDYIFSYSVQGSSGSRTMVEEFKP